MPRKDNITKSKLFHLKAELVFLILGLVAGALLCVFIPYGAGFDEESHLVRIYDMARGNLIPNQPGSTALLEFYSLSYQRRYLQTPADNLFEPENFTLRADHSTSTDAVTVSTYSPVVFLIEAVIARVAWLHFDLPILPVVILLRFAGLCLYLLLGYLAIRMVPIGKWVLATLLLAPMALYQAATLNGDRFTIGASVFFIAAVLKVFSKKETPLNLKDSLLLALGCLLIGTAKSGTIILLPLLFILTQHRFASKKYTAIFLAGIVLSILYSIGWSFFSVLGTVVAATGKTRTDQILLVLHHFPEFLSVYFTGVIHLLPKYYTDWVAEYGYWVGTVPWPVYLIFPIALILSFLPEGRNPAFTRKSRLIILAVAIFCLALIASVKFVWAFVPGELYFGSQGRYFLPFAPVLFLAFAGLIELPPKWKATTLVAGIFCIVATLALYGYGLYRTYYTTCVYAVDANHPCTLPVYKNLEVGNPARVLLSSGTTLEQSFDPECAPLDSIDLRVLDKTGSSGTLKLSFYDPKGNLLAESELPVAKLKKGQQNTRFLFPSVNVTGNNTYSYKLELSSDSKATLTFMGVTADSYGKGQLLVNGDSSTEAADLYFQFECAR